MTTTTAIKRKHPLAECEVCPLAARGCAPSQQPIGKAKAAIVSRSPGYHDVIAGVPFAGPSGKVLDHLLRTNGVKRSEVLITNVVLCSPPEGKVPPEAIKACSKRLASELGDISLVVAAGAEAVNSVIGRGTIDYYRGYRIARARKVFVATNNPALVLRDDSTFPNLVKDFKRAFHPIPAPTMPKVSLIEDANGARQFINHYTRFTGTVAADIESRGGLTHKANVVSLQFSFDGTTAYVLGERQGIFEDRDFIANYLRPFLESTDRNFVWHNGIFDTKIIRYTYGINARVDEDTLLLSYALDERGGVHELDYLLMEEFGWPHYTPASVNSFKKTGKLVSDAEAKALAKQHPMGPAYDKAYQELQHKNYVALYKYAGYDAAGTYQLYQLLQERATKEGVYQAPYKETLIASNEVLHAMEVTGMPYDFNHAAEMLECEVQPELDRIKYELRAATSLPLLNPNSTTQMAAFYYDEHGIMHAMRNRPDKARSTDESARKEIIDGRFTFKGETGDDFKDTTGGAEIKAKLQQVAEMHDRSQKLAKQASNYLTSLIREAEVDPESRVYTTLPRHATSTGRLASRGPNLQNITRTKEGLPDIRGLFYAPDGELLVQADYSQAELRTIAALSGDPLLKGVYERGEDLHNLTAERFYGPNYTSENRSNSKNMNFGVFYRQSAETFLEKHEIPVEEAREYIEWVWSTFKGVGAWEKSIEELVHTNKGPGYTYVRSPFGHRRRFYLITNENRNASYREAINFLPQNIAANLTLHACIEMHKRVDRQQAALCLTVHDSILAQVKEDYVDTYSKLCQEVMESRAKELLGWDLPFLADVGVGKTWATAK